MAYTYKYPRPALTVDAVLFAWSGELQTLLIRRADPPFQDCWAFPGGFVDMDETLEQAVVRELAEETGLTGIPLEAFGAFSRLDRDPRGRTVSVAYLGLTRVDAQPPVAASDAAAAEWFPLSRLPELAFDHDDLLAAARHRLRERTLLRPLGRELLPQAFAMADLHSLYRAALSADFGEQHFSRLALASGLLTGQGPYRFSPQYHQGYRSASFPAALLQP